MTLLLPLSAVVLLALATVLPIGALLIRSLFDRQGNFIGLANFVRYASEPGLTIAAWNSIVLSGIATTLTIVIAYPVAYAFNRSRMPFKGAFRTIILLPLLAPSLLPALGLIYILGTQGSPRACCSAVSSTGRTALSSRPSSTHCRMPC